MVFTAITFCTIINEKYVQRNSSVIILYRCPILEVIKVCWQKLLECQNFIKWIFSRNFFKNFEGHELVHRWNHLQKSNPGLGLIVWKGERLADSEAVEYNSFKHSWYSHQANFFVVRLATCQYRMGLINYYWNVHWIRSALLINLMAASRKLIFLKTLRPRIEPRASGCVAQMLPLCCAAPPPQAACER